jgi:hypothetical protein
LQNTQEDSGKLDEDGWDVEEKRELTLGVSCLANLGDS